MAEHDDNEHDDDLDPELADQFEAWFTKRTDEEKRKAERAKPPKDFGDALSRIADAVADTLEERATARAKAREDADQAPSRGGGGDGLLGLLGGKSKSA